MAVKGTWNIGGYNLPDYGITEFLRGVAGKTASGEVTTRYNNPAVINQQKLVSNQLNTDLPNLSAFYGNNNGQVLGATNNTNTNNGTNGTNPVVKTDTGGQPDPNNPNPGSGGNNDALAKLLAEIDSSYNSGMDVLNTQEARLAPENAADIANLTGRVDLQKTAATNEGTQLQSDITDQEKQQYGVIENAYQQALRARNALGQQIMSRYGLGSSTGGAVSDLASQEFYRQMGGLNEQKVNVGDQVMKEIGKVKLFTKGKLDELDQYKNTAVDALKKDLADRLNTIATARADINTNKAQMRLSAIQDTISSAREIANQATTFRQTIATNAINQIQTTMGRSLTPNEIKAVMNDYGIEGFSTIGSNTTASVNPNYYGKTTTEDPLKDLIG